MVKQNVKKQEIRIFSSRDQKAHKCIKKPVFRCLLRNTGFIVLAGAEGLEPSARGFGDRCSTN